MLFSSLFYAIGCFVLASLMTVFKTMCRPSYRRDDQRAWLTFLVCFAFVGISPYVFMEILTKTQGPSMEKAIKASYANIDVQGPMQFYKVRWYTGSTASVYVVGKELQSWGGYDHPVIALNMKKVNGEWVADSFKPVDWPRLNKDGIVFPPMW
jgi:hypothetical protein